MAKESTRDRVRLSLDLKQKDDDELERIVQGLKQPSKTAALRKMLEITSAFLDNMDEQGVVRILDPNSTSRDPKVVAIVPLI